MERRTVESDCGRYVHLYTFDGRSSDPESPDDESPGSNREIRSVCPLTLPRDGRTPERRWDPFQREWIVTATSRQDRTFKPPKDTCPFCPTDPDAASPTAIPVTDYDVAVVENAFPSFRSDTSAPSVPMGVAS